MINNPLVSILIPLYNKQDYVSQCLCSIKEQTYQNIEVIIVNDGSTDASLEISKSIIADDNRFKIISKPNGGSATARKCALNNANGDYILVCDSDDMLPQNAVELLITKATEKNSDIVIGDILKNSINSKEIMKHINEYDYLGLLKAILLGEYHSSTCNKLIKRNLCREQYYEDGVDYMEDKLFLTYVLVNSKPKIDYVSEVTYIYNFVSDSYTNNVSIKSVINSIFVTDRICELITGIIPKNLIQYSLNYNKLFVVLASDISQSKRVPKSLDKILFDSSFSFKHRIILWSVKNDFRWPVKMYKFIQKLVKKI